MMQQKHLPNSNPRRMKARKSIGTEWSRGRKKNFKNKIGKSKAVPAPVQEQGMNSHRLALPRQPPRMDGGSGRGGDELSRVHLHRLGPPLAPTLRKETATPRPAYLSAAPPPSLPSRGKQSLRSVKPWSTCWFARRPHNEIHLMMRRAPRSYRDGRVHLYHRHTARC